MNYATVTQEILEQYKNTFGLRFSRGFKSVGKIDKEKTVKLLEVEMYVYFAVKLLDGELSPNCTWAYTHRREGGRHNAVMPPDFMQKIVTLYLDI